MYLKKQYTLYNNIYMRVYACVWFRDDCLSLLVALFSETACKDSTNNWNMQTFFCFFCDYLDFCLFF